ncbi:c-type cytochrome [Ramlibacter sp. AN1133]|uniref:c-type cytochrome n=1 Tax=Ramlibacter sp. AN1133 TaxID=3133429 RepID=UPI0030BD3740
MRVGHLAALLLAACVPCAQAADPQAGRTRAQACAVCHGPLGLSMVPNAPHLAGQPEIYLAEQLRNFRSGRRPHEVMGVIAKDLSDQEIEDLAAWFASLRVEVRER